MRKLVLTICLPFLLTAASCDVDAAPGVHALWMNFSGHGGPWPDRPELFELDWIQFE